MSTTRRYALSHDVAFPRAQVWELLAQTDRLNRQIGLVPVFYEEAKVDEFGIYRPASAKFSGVRMHWREYLFQWEENERYTVVRRYAKGPIASFEGGLELEALDANHTRLTLWSRMGARGKAGGLAVPLIARRFLRRAIKFCKSAFVEGQPPPRPQGPPPRPAQWNQAALQKGIERLRKAPIEDAYALELQRFISTAGEDEVAAMRPFAWADIHGFDRHQALRLCLYAVRVGLLNLRWAMMCPNCRTSKDEVSSLAQMPAQVHCDLCGVNYDLNFDRYVELRFAVHPSVRVASSDIYCVGGPFRTPHVVEQYTIGAGQTHSFKLAAKVPVRLRVIGPNHAIDVDKSDAGCRFTLSDAGWTRHDKTESDASQSESEVALLHATNATGAPRAIALEKRAWDETAATAASVTELQEFRDLFSSEVLAPGRQVAVENVTLFFSDLSNSTALYEEIGDAPAYSRVGNHFDLLTRNVMEGNGAVVKTMGDAVMAVFHRPEDALLTALRVQRQFHEFAETLDYGGEIKLKIGLHSGPVLAVNSNDRLDYFGRTVNIAARAVGVSNGGDIILTGEVWTSDAVRELVESQNLRSLHFQTTLRGVEATRELVRIRP